MNDDLIQPDVIQPGELVEPTTHEANPLAVQAAKTEMEQEATQTKADVWSRTLRTLVQGALVVALVAGFTSAADALTAGSTDYRAIALAAGQAVLTAAVSYLHNKLSPKG